MPCSLLSLPSSLFPLLSSLFPVPCSLFPKTRNSVAHQIKNRYSIYK
ncbi:hypothetical protein [Moorena sp. SIO4G3]|nr:hypothetical protein [Moorena sp. SIO4G3]NEO81542.1 hypothetical protein [Moorena sp. SIO4G3]